MNIQLVFGFIIFRLIFSINCSRSVHAIHTSIQTQTTVKNAKNTKPTPTTTITTAPTFSNPVYSPVCWSTTMTYSPKPVASTDCRSAIDLVASMPLPDKPRIFTPYAYRDDYGQLQPSFWAVGSCFIYVKSVLASTVTELRFFDIMERALRINEYCVQENPERLGGWTGIGTLEKGFFVSVAGTRSAFHLGLGADGDFDGIQGEGENGTRPLEGGESSLVGTS